MKREKSEHLHYALRSAAAYDGDPNCSIALRLAAEAFQELADINAELTALAAEIPDGRLRFVQGRVASLLVGESAPKPRQVAGKVR